MKIRTDFVTNSSSSSFIVSIEIQLKDDYTISFIAEGGTPESGKIDWFEGDAIISVSPKELANAESVDDMIKLLVDGVVDDTLEQQRKIFENPEGVVREGDPEYENLRDDDEDDEGGIFILGGSPYYFIDEIRDEIESMDQIERVTISGDERNYVNYNRSFTYDKSTGRYFGVVKGEEFEKDGSSGGDLRFDLTGCDIEYKATEDVEDFY